MSSVSAAVRGVPDRVVLPIALSGTAIYICTAQLSLPVGASLSRCAPDQLRARPQDPSCMPPAAKQRPPAVLPRALNISQRMLSVAASETTSNFKAEVMSVLLALWNMRHIVSTLLDIATDIILITELWPHRVAFMLIVPMFVADVAGAVLIYRAFTSSLQVRAAAGGNAKGGGEAGDASSPFWVQAAQHHEHELLPGWAASLQQMYAGARRKGPAATAGAAIVLVSCLSVTVHLLSAVLFLPWMLAGGTFGSLEIVKCAELRSLMVALVEAPASMVFSTWAYLEHRKYMVGKYVSSRAFLFSLATSMVHVLIELASLSARVAEHGSFEEAWKSYLDLQFDTHTSDIVRFGSLRTRKSWLSSLGTAKSGAGLSSASSKALSSAQSGVPSGLGSSFAKRAGSGPLSPAGSGAMGLQGAGSRALSGAGSWDAAAGDVAAAAAAAKEAPAAGTIAEEQLVVDMTGSAVRPGAEPGAEAPAGRRTSSERATEALDVDNEREPCSQPQPGVGGIMIQPLVTHFSGVSLPSSVDGAAGSVHDDSHSEGDAGEQPRAPEGGKSSSPRPGTGLGILGATAGSGSKHAMCSSARGWSQFSVTPKACDCKAEHSCELGR